MVLCLILDYLGKVYQNQGSIVLWLIFQKYYPLMKDFMAKSVFGLRGYNRVRV